MSQRTVIEERREIPVIGEYEVVVIGGGPAGIAAAMAAGRTGRSTVLVERYGFLGGAGTAAGLSTFCGLHAVVGGEHRQVVHGVADDILERLEHMGGLNKPHLTIRDQIQAQAYDISAYKIAADELLLAANVKLLFHAWGVAAIMRSQTQIDAVLIETKSGRKALAGKMFIDATGDGDLAVWAGAPCEIGDGKGNMLYPSTMFRINAVDHRKAGKAWDLIPKLMEEAQAKGVRQFPRKKPIVRPQRDPIEWRANLTQIKNPDGTAASGVDYEQLSYGEIEGRRQCWDVFDFIRRSTPGFEQAYIVEIAPQIGIRETRRVRGEYMVTGEDVLGCADFADAIGVNGWPVEAHVSGDVNFVFQKKERGFNQLPYRMIVPKSVENLFVTGRCASMTHEAQSSARVSGSCFVMGQAAGTAADLALAAGTTPREVNVSELQRSLERDGAYLGWKW